MNINWTKGAVYYANGEQHYTYNEFAHEAPDFQLNIPRPGCYIGISDVRALESYERLIGILETFGYKQDPFTKALDGINFPGICIDRSGTIQDIYDDMPPDAVDKFTIPQLLAISIIYKEMDNTTDEQVVNDAFAMLKAMNIEYDTTKKRWFKREWIDIDEFLLDLRAK